MKTVIVIGAGAAGLMAAGQAAEMGGRVILFEKNSQPGKKILITGKGRCNITNEADLGEFITNFPGNGQFLYSALNAFSNWDLTGFLSDRGLTTKVERGGRVFPASDKAADVVAVLERFCRDTGIEFVYNRNVREVIVDKGVVKGVKVAGGAVVAGEAVIIATGGASYPGTGSTGDGYRMAKQVGHKVIPPKPALVPLETSEEWIKELQGLTLNNVRVKASAANEVIAEEFGEMLFTHFGVSGPIVLTISRSVQPYLEQGQKVKLEINLKPALSEEQLDNRLLRDFEQFKKKQFKNSLGELLPSSIIPIIVKLSGIPGDRPVHQINRRERLTLVGLLQGLPITVTRTRPLKEAIVTAGGVTVKEINPKTMESKLVSGLFFAGEVIDVDGYTGGYNLQAAFSTGYVAGRSAAQE